MRKFIHILLLLALLISGCSGSSTNISAGQNKSNTTENNTNVIEITDDTGNVIRMHKPAKKIISLYAAHTENLFSLGLDQEIIGVGLNDKYPAPALTKTKFDYRADPEKVLALEPDLVLIRPFIKRGFPDFVKVLENAGVTVVCLYPEKYSDFIPYINKLAKITGTEPAAEKLLADWSKRVTQIEQNIAGKNPRQKVFFESTANQRTITKDSLAAGVLMSAGAEVLFLGTPVVDRGTSIAQYDPELLVEQAENIDVYIAQKGVMNPTVSIEALQNKVSYENIKAIKNNRILIIDEKIISSPTFRMLEGMEQIADFLYPN